jgi:hypothetical protein
MWWSLVSDIVWHRWRKWLLFIFTAITTYSAIAEACSPSKLPTMKDILPVWEWWTWLVIALILLEFATFIVAAQKMRLLQKHDNWIIAYQAKKGKLPAIPESLKSMVINYAPKKTISKQIELNLRPSNQQWHRLTSDNKERFLQIMDWLGLDRYDFLQCLEDARPPGGQATTHLHRTR